MINCVGIYKPADSVLINRDFDAYGCLVINKTSEKGQWYVGIGLLHCLIKALIVDNF